MASLLTMNGTTSVVRVQWTFLNVADIVEDDDDEISLAECSAIVATTWPVFSLRSASDPALDCGEGHERSSDAEDEVATIESFRESETEEESSSLDRSGPCSPKSAGFAEQTLDVVLFASEWRSAEALQIPCPPLVPPVLPHESSEHESDSRDALLDMSTEAAGSSAQPWVLGACSDPQLRWCDLACDQQGGLGAQPATIDVSELQCAPAMPVEYQQSAEVEQQQPRHKLQPLGSGRLSERRRPARPCKGARSDDIATRGRTTIMLRNLPNDYSRGMFMDLLDSLGFAGQYDFVYLPTDFATGSNIGYAFVNCVKASGAERLWQVLDGFSRWTIQSRKVCSVCWSDPCQGLDANIRRYRNSPVMCQTVPEEFKPMLFSGGRPVPFPAPTKVLRPPHITKPFARRS